MPANRYRFEVDFLTPNDSECNNVSYVFADNIDQAIDDTRANYEQRGEIVFRIRWNGETIWKAKGQDW